MQVVHWWRRWRCSVDCAVVKVHLVLSVSIHLQGSRCSLLDVVCIQHFVCASGYVKNVRCRTNGKPDHLFVDTLVEAKRDLVLVLPLTVG